MSIGRSEAGRVFPVHSRALPRAVDQMKAFLVRSDVRAQAFQRLGRQRILMQFIPGCAVVAQRLFVEIFKGAAQKICGILLIRDRRDLKVFWEEKLPPGARDFRVQAAGSRMIQRHPRRCNPNP